MSKTTRKRSIVLGLLATLAITATAIAYFSSTGNGSGSGTVTDQGRAVLDVSVAAPTFTQLEQTKTFTISAKNKGTSAVHSSVASVTLTAPEGCPDGSFTKAPVVATGGEIAPGATREIGTVAVTFNNKPSVQDACLAGPTLSVTTN